MKRKLYFSNRGVKHICVCIQFVFERVWEKTLERLVKMIGHTNFWILVTSFWRFVDRKRVSNRSLRFQTCFVPMHLFIYLLINPIYLIIIMIATKFPPKLFIYWIIIWFSNITMIFSFCYCYIFFLLLFIINFFVQGTKTV